jgi:hypothetical protein
LWFIAWNIASICICVNQNRREKLDTGVRVSLSMRDNVRCGREERRRRKGAERSLQPHTQARQDIEKELGGVDKVAAKCRWTSERRGRSRREMKSERNIPVSDKFFREHKMFFKTLNVIMIMS